MKDFQVLQSRVRGGGRDARRRCLAFGLVEERRNQQETLELALRKSRLVVETDLAGRKKRDGKCAGRVQQVSGTCLRGRKKMGTRSVCAEHAAGPVCSSSKTVATRSPFSLFSFSPFLFSFLSFLSFFLSFFLYIRLIQTNRANEWSSAWGP